MYKELADSSFLLCLAKRCIDLNNRRESSIYSKGLLPSMKGRCELIFYVVQNVDEVLFCM